MAMPPFYRRLGFALLPGFLSLTRGVATLLLVFQESIAEIVKQLFCHRRRTAVCFMSPLFPLVLSVLSGHSGCA